MAGPGIIAGSEQRIKINDDYLNANSGNTNAVIDLLELTPPAAFQKESRRLPNAGRMGKFEPRGISCDGSKTNNGSTDLTASSAFVNAKEKSEQHFLQQRYNCGMIHAARITKIKPFNTTARGIIIHG